MKHTKREWIPLYNFLDRTRLTAHLSEMAAQGWLLTSISSWSWKYRRTEPRKLKFAVTLFAGAGRVSPAPAPGLDTFRDYCAQAGWQVAASMDQVQVFYNEDENAVPLETDSALELANIQKSIGGPLKKSYLALLVLSLFQLGFGLWRLVRDPVDNIGNSSSLLSTGAYLPLSVLILWGLLAYRRWLRKAGAAAETGAPLPDLPSAKWLSILTMVWSALLVLASFATVSRSAGMVLSGLGQLPRHHRPRHTSDGRRSGRTDGPGDRQYRYESLRGPSGGGDLHLPGHHLVRLPRPHPPADRGSDRG